MEYAPEKSVFSGFEIIDRQFESRSFTRGDYPNACEIVALREEKILKFYGVAAVVNGLLLQRERDGKKRERCSEETLEIESEESLIKR
ncbi:MAG: hypothetical protein KBH15_00330 [Candidatus Atribacteria bacterium]|mgnify:CR=1 FL=1|nr:hypothetical protein [Candidatus Atribacteria bacterium]